MRHPTIVESPAPAPLAGSGTADFVWRSEADTQAFAQQLALCPALRQAFVQLHGDLGAGKTTLARHLLQALGVQGRIKSPTYTVVEPYALPGLDVWHFDFYRFADPAEWEDAGFRDIFASPGLKLAEWPQRAGRFLPQADLEIHLTVGPDEARAAHLVAPTPAGRALLHAVALPGSAASGSRSAQGTPT